MYLVGRRDVGVYADYDRLCSTDIFWFLAVAADNVGFWPEWQHELECGLQNLASWEAGFPNNDQSANQCTFHHSTDSFQTEEFLKIQFQFSISKIYEKKLEILYTWRSEVTAQWSGVFPSASCISVLAPFLSKSWMYSAGPPLAAAQCNGVLKFLSMTFISSLFQCFNTKGKDPQEGRRVDKCKTLTPPWS